MTRIEGHLRLDVEIEGVQKARSRVFVISRLGVRLPSPAPANSRGYWFLPVTLLALGNTDEARG